VPLYRCLCFLWVTGTSHVRRCFCWCDILAYVLISGTAILEATGTLRNTDVWELDGATVAGAAELTTVDADVTVGDAFPSSEGRNSGNGPNDARAARYISLSQLWYRKKSEECHLHTDPFWRLTKRLVWKAFNGTLVEVATLRRLKINLKTSSQPCKLQVWRRPIPPCDTGLQTVGRPCNTVGNHTCKSMHPIWS